MLRSRIPSMSAVMTILLGAAVTASPAAGQRLVETGWEPDPEHPFRIPNAEPAEPIDETDAEKLGEAFAELTDGLEGASWVVVAPHEGGFREVLSVGEPGDGRMKLGRVTPLLIGLAAASYVEDDMLDLEQEIYVYHKPLAGQLQKNGRAPTINELMSGLGGARVVGPAAYERPLFNQEVAGLLEQRPGRRLIPSEAGPAVVAWLFGVIDEGTARQALGNRLKKIGVDGVSVPSGGQLTSTPRALAEGLVAIVADEPGIEPKILAELGKPRLGTFDLGLGFRIERVEHGFGWVWNAVDPERGLAVRIDHERQSVSVLHAPGIENIAELAEDLSARYEQLVPSPREALDNVSRFNKRIYARERLNKLDQNKDGRVSLDDEIDLAVRAGYLKFDSNANGYLTLNEFVQNAGQNDYR